MTFKEEFPSLKEHKVIIRECFMPKSRNWVKTSSEVVSIGRIKECCLDKEKVKDAIFKYMTPLPSMDKAIVTRGALIMLLKELRL